VVEEFEKEVEESSHKKQGSDQRASQTLAFRSVALCGGGFVAFGFLAFAK
jgi:hypothetical protein